MIPGKISCIQMCVRSIINIYTCYQDDKFDEADLNKLLIGVVNYVYNEGYRVNKDMVYKKGYKKGFEAAKKQVTERIANSLFEE